MDCVKHVAFAIAMCLITLFAGVFFALVVLVSTIFTMWLFGLSDSLGIIALMIWACIWLGVGIGVMECLDKRSNNEQSSS